MLDQASRKRRQRKALEALEADNFQDDPHADLKMNKRAPKFDTDFNEGTKLYIPIRISYFLCSFVN